MCADTAAPVDYRDTVFLPETAFPMRAGLPQREPEWLELVPDDLETDEQGSELGTDELGSVNS